MEAKASKHASKREHACEVCARVCVRACACAMGGKTKKDGTLRHNMSQDGGVHTDLKRFASFFLYKLRCYPL